MKRKSKKKVQRDIFGSVAHFQKDCQETPEGTTDKSQFSSLFSPEALEILVGKLDTQSLLHKGLKITFNLAKEKTFVIKEGHDYLYIAKMISAVLPAKGSDLVKQTNIVGVSGEHDKFRANLIVDEWQRINPERTKIIATLKHSFGTTVTDVVIDNQTGKVVKQSVNQLTGEKYDRRVPFCDVLRRMKTICRQHALPAKGATCLCGDEACGAKVSLF